MSRDYPDSHRRRERNDTGSPPDYGYGEQQQHHSMKYKNPSYGGGSGTHGYGSSKYGGRPSMPMEDDMDDMHYHYRGGGHDHMHGRHGDRPSAGHMQERMPDRMPDHREPHREPHRDLHRESQRDSHRDHHRDVHREVPRDHYRDSHRDGYRDDHRDEMMHGYNREPPMRE